MEYFMLDDYKKEIIFRGIEKKIPLSEIAALASCSKATVSYYKKSFKQSAAKTDIMALKKIIGQWIADDLQFSKKLRHTKQRIFFRLQTEHCYHGSFNLVNKLISEIKLELKNSSVKNIFSSYSFMGECYISCRDFSFIETNISRDGYLLCLTFSKSLAVFIQIIRTKNIECILQALKDIFNHIGKVPSSLIFMKNTGIDFDFPQLRHVSELYYKFKFNYNFIDIFNPIMNGVSSVKLAVLPLLKNTIKSQFNCLSNYNKELLSNCSESLNKKCHIYNYSVKESFDEEKYHMIKLPENQIEICSWKKLKVSALSYILLDYKYKYYLPPKFANQYAYVAIYSDCIKIFDIKMNLIINYERLYYKLCT